MIAWLNPGAFVGLVALAVPVILHLLRRRRAVRLAFPSIRFLDPSLTGAVRLRRPSDLWLLALRLATLALAVCAFAQPVVLTPARLRGWNARTVRAVVVDVSESMRLHQADAERSADAELRSASEAVRIDAANLAEGVRRAVGKLLTSAPGRREVVVVSDFQTGSIDRAVVDGVPKGVGLRFLPIEPASAETRFAGLALAAGGGEVRYQSITVNGPRTRVLVSRAGERIRGLELMAADASRSSSLLDVVAASGAPAPAPDRPIVMFLRSGRGEPFMGRYANATPSAIAVPWMIDAVLELRRDEELGRAARNTPAGFGTAAASPPWTVVARSAGGGPVVRVAALDRALAIDVAAPADAYLAAAALRAALWARGGDVVRQFAEREVLRIPDDRLAQWSRKPEPVGRDGWPQSIDTDARWFWAAVLALMALEAAVSRRKPADAAPEARAG